MSDLTRLTDVTVELTVEVGRARMSLGQTLNLGPGSVVALSRSARDPVDLLVNGKPIARGEVVVIDDDFGLRITEVLEESADAEVDDTLEQLAEVAELHVEHASDPVLEAVPEPDAEPEPEAEAA